LKFDGREGRSANAKRPIALLALARETIAWHKSKPRAPVSAGDVSTLPNMPTLSTSDAALEREVFWDRYKKEVMAVLILALVGVAAFGGYRLYADRQANAAASRLADAKTAPEFQKVIAEYPNTPAGASAYLLLADAQRNEKKFSEASATLQTFLEKFPKHELAGTARLAIAGNLEALGKKDEALATYQRLVASDPKGFAAPVALFSQIHLLKEKKQIEEARRVCETMMTQYRESRFAAEASYQLRLLKVPNEPAATPAPPPPAAVASAPPAPQSSAPSAAAPPAPKAPKPKKP
jgi:predicted negative regulator of RcsB-dependent stress response